MKPKSTTAQPSAFAPSDAGDPASTLAAIALGCAEPTRPRSPSSVHAADRCLHRLHSIGDNAAGNRQAQQFRCPPFSRSTTSIVCKASPKAKAAVDAVRTCAFGSARRAERHLLHAGDFLSPSLISRGSGASMIDIMNRPDGEPDGFDSRMPRDLRQPRIRHFEVQRRRSAAQRAGGRSQHLAFAANLDFPTPGMRGMLERRTSADALSSWSTTSGRPVRPRPTPDQVGEPAYPNNERSRRPPQHRLLARARRRGDRRADASVARRDETDRCAGAGSISVGGHDHRHGVAGRGGKVRGVKAD